MNALTLAGKKEQLREVTTLLESDGYRILVAELERKKQEGIELACDVKLTQAERDAGAGVKRTAEELLAFMPLKQRSLESTIKKLSSSSKGNRQ